MADIHNKATLSFNMSRIKGKNTNPELKISGAKWWCTRCQRHHMFIETSMCTRDSAGVALFLPTNFFYKHSNPLDLEKKTKIELHSPMPAASHVYRNINVHKKFDSSRVALLQPDIYFYKHSNPLDLYFVTFFANFKPSPCA